MRYLRYIIILVIAGSLFGCELPDNINPKMASVVPAKALFTSAEAMLVEHINSLDQNKNIARLLAQYNAQTTYYGESQWNFYDRALPDEMWETMYRDILLDFKEAKRLIDADKSLTSEIKANQKAVIDILEVYSYHDLVDVNGNIP